MKQLKQKIEITFSWWRSGGEDIKDEHLEALQESAEIRVQEMIAESYTSGELHDNIRLTDEDGEDGIEYSGWWERTITTV